MTSRYIWQLHELFKKVWVRVISFTLLALLSVVLARVLAPYLPEAVALQIGEKTVEDMLSILTSSMLAVTTFSLAIAVSAFAAATESATPRATILLQEDRTTQNVLATFLGAFLFGLVGLIALHAELYNEAGKVVVFLFTAAVIGLVVVALIRWIGHLMEFGRMGDTLDRVEKAAAASLNERLENPFLGGRPLTEPVPDDCVAVVSTETGYVQHIDMQELQKCADKLDTKIYVRCLPGTFVHRGRVLLSVAAAEVKDQAADAMRRAVTTGSHRTFEGDPRFGLIVMTEIASKALSPAVNDPGTAIDVLGRLTRILSDWRDRPDAEVRFSRLIVPPITVQDVFEDAFRPIARDGAAFVEVQIRLQKTLAALAEVVPEVFTVPARKMAQDALERARASSLMAADMAAIQAASVKRGG
ncbi:hypothetical protein IDSA_01545 [Pseudidiomarina salinarum]|uniref:DUF2254 domain-containing protein n=1 Tax=Pseudidiomarina salinarum TaxID=435908 RepID=A0A094J042_9GAMM|nr:DUF2254 domain-containing protein [Pseudidiomarina salinarum]KFZ31429.1 hypothetical protein IDSA_01545 [Pseudidiomarina salinarum]RUO70812.1 DUF2254 domain-containing protein [Pseudidiomarina salinarum]